MKILYHHRIRSKDGQFVHVEELVHALRAAGHEVIFVGPRAIEQEGFGADAGAVAALKRALPQSLYELLELGYACVAFVRLLWHARRQRPDFIYERYNLFSPAGIWVKRLLGLPLVLEINAPLFEERSRFDGLAMAGLAKWSERYVWRGADVVAVVTGVLAARVRAAGVPAERIAVIPNGINRTRFSSAPDAIAAKRALGLDGKCVLGFVGFVRSWHGIDRVLEFLASEGDPQLHLLLVGDGPARAQLEAVAHTLGIRDRVTFTGIVGREAVAAHVAAFDVALQPAVVDYASPLKLFEYLALGKAIVAPASANIMEVLTHEHNALLFDTADSASLCTEMRRLCRDEALRARLGVAAVATIDELGLTWAHNAERVVALARDARAQRGAGAAVRV